MFNESCPCCSELLFNECCNPYISGNQHAPTAEALMRSRYTAYTLVNIDYIQKTMFGRALNGFCFNDTKKWAEQLKWIGLQIIKEQQDDRFKAYVEFIAFFYDNKNKKSIHERSEFHCIDNIWFYVDGIIF